MHTFAVHCGFTWYLILFTTFNSWSWWIAVFQSTPPLFNLLPIFHNFKLYWNEYIIVHKTFLQLRKYFLAYIHRSEIRILKSMDILVYTPIEKHSKFVGKICYLSPVLDILLIIGKQFIFFSNGYLSMGLSYTKYLLIPVVSP